MFDLPHFIPDDDFDHKLQGCPCGVEVKELPKVGQIYVHKAITIEEEDTFPEEWVNESS